MPRTHRLAALAAVLTLAAGACQKTETSYGAPSTCPADEPCHSNVKGGSGSSGSGGGGGAGGASAQADAGGKVAVVVSAAFDQTASFTGKATIVAPGASGGDVIADYDGSAGPFSMTGLASGPAWFFVKDPTGGAGIFSTFSVQEVPSTSLVVPVVEQTVISEIASALPVPAAVASGRAHIVVFVDRGGQPLSGVSLSGGGFGGTVAYDQGAGFYSNGVKTTGSAGVIVILNADPSGSGQGTATIHVTDANGSPFSLDVPVAADAVTLAGMSI